MKIALVTIASLLIAFPESSIAHESCPYICETIDDCLKKAEWVIEGTIADIIGDGSRKNVCETSFNGPFCRDIENPETLVLSDVKLMKGHFFVGINQMAVAPRKYTCFNGFLSFMNSKPEKKKLGVRVRLFGNNAKQPIYVRPGYYYLEEAEEYKSQ